MEPSGVAAKAHQAEVDLEAVVDPRVVVGGGHPKLEGSGRFYTPIDQGRWYRSGHLAVVTSPFGSSVVNRALVCGIK